MLALLLSERGPAGTAAADRRAAALGKESGCRQAAVSADGITRRAAGRAATDAASGRKALNSPNFICTLIQKKMMVRILLQAPLVGGGLEPTAEVRGDQRPDPSRPARGIDAAARGG